MANRTSGSSPSPSPAPTPPAAGGAPAGGAPAAPAPGGGGAAALAGAGGGLGENAAMVAGASTQAASDMAATIALAAIARKVALTEAFAALMKKGGDALKAGI